MKNLYKKKVLFFSISIVLLFVLTILICNYHYQNVNHRLQWWLKEIDWDNNRKMLTGKGVKIAILDTGIDFAHKDLKNCNYSEKNIVGKKSDDLDHGTAIAGIIAAYPHNDNGILGIAPDVEILSVNITNNEYVEEKNLIKGINLAIKNDVDIINISVGIKENSPELYKSIKKAYDSNIVIIASAGNYMKDDVLYPAAYEEVLAVGSYDKKGNVISPKNIMNSVIYLPGKNISTCISNDKYAGVQGTSFSTAILTGIIAIIKENDIKVDNRTLYKSLEEMTGLKNSVTVKKLLKKMEDKK